MHPLSLLAPFIAGFVAAATLGWWIATILTGAYVRANEGRRPFTAGPVWACGIRLLAVGVFAAVLSGGAAFLLFKLLVQVPDAVGLDHSFAGRAWRSLVWIGAALVAASGFFSAVARGAAALADARCRWQLLEPSAPAEFVQPAEPPPLSGRRSIVILCDGTSNRPDQKEDGRAAPTNVFKLSEALQADDAQTVWYEPGVGSDTSSTAAQVRRTRAALSVFGVKAGAQVATFFSRVVRLVESGFGSGISETIVKGYAEVVQRYRPGDRIYIVGFSRGAFAARCIAGVISRCGLLRAENLRYAPQVVQAFRTRPDPREDAPIRKDLLHPPPDIEFVGVFDTVASLGVPLWGWWFRVVPIWKNKSFATDPAPACRHVYHALAMDERRSEFLPTLYTPPPSPQPGDTFEQVWFRGNHCDVGGGYARSELSDITLGWMMDAMERHGLRFRPDARKALVPNKLGQPHDEIAARPGWALLGSWPRWHPVPGAAPDPERSTLHPTVLERATFVQEMAGRPDLLQLETHQPFSFTAGSQRTWDRTGIVIEQGACYRLTYRGDRWQDAENARCSPWGQEAEGFWDSRRLWTRWRRLRDEPWMRLVATVAHPRPWPPEEKDAGELWNLLFRNDPDALTRQLAAIGADLDKPGDSIVIRNLAPSGLLYLFANDWWQTATNNSGGVRLELERLAEPNGPVDWTLLRDGTWQHESIAR